MSRIPMPPSPAEEAQQDADELSSRESSWRHALLRFLLARMRGSEDARDLAQDVYLRILQARPRGVRNAEAYVKTVAGHALSEWYYTRNSSPVTCDSNLAEAQSQMFGDTASDPCEKLISEENEDRLLRILNQIKDPYRTVLIMHRCHGLTHEEIADRLGLAKGTVHNYIVRAFVQARRANWD